VPRIVPDNLKTGVIKHPREGEVVLNDAYREMAAHYSAAVLPGRVRAPKDKASVENTVAHVATWIIAGLRQRQFTSLPELRAAIIERVAAYNAEPFQKRPGSRASVFAAEEQPLLTGLPAAAYEISRWVYGRRVGRNGHVVWERNYYSVPFANIGTTVDLRITDRVLQAYRGAERLTSHLLLPEGAANEYRTNDADLPAGGLKGLPEAITTVWALAVVQTCIVHLIRNTFRYAARQYWDEMARDPPGLHSTFGGGSEGTLRGVLDQMGPAVPGNPPGCGKTPGASSCRSWTTTSKSGGSSAAPTPSNPSTPATGARSGPGAISPPSRRP
jgi:hypothetical protein